MHPYIAIPVTLALVWRAYSRDSLTPAGILTATLTAVVHAIHPWSVFFALLVVFFLAGTAVTKVKHDVKARLTLSATGSQGGEGQRTHIQTGSNYLAVAADTFSSELGILSKSRPRLLTSWSFRKVPPGTNGGITFWGTMAGFLGASVIAVTSVLLLPFCPVGPTSTTGKLFGDNQPSFEGGSGWGLREKLAWVIAATIWGGMGSLLDSALGGWFQASVIDARTGKVVEGTGGAKVLLVGSYEKKDGNSSRRVESGIGVLDNNTVNVLMALIMSVGEYHHVSNPEMKQKLADMHQKDHNGKIRERNHLLRRPLIVEGDDLSKTFNSAGSGCFGPPAEYCGMSLLKTPVDSPFEPSYSPPCNEDILATLLNSGTSPAPQNRILSDASIEGVFTDDQIPQFVDFGRRCIPGAKIDLTNPIPELYRQPPEQPQRCGISK
ncbi:MAG: hypothetical protein Q9173_002485 [Seirophora scorigena]